MLVIIKSDKEKVVNKGWAVTVFNHKTASLLVTQDIAE